MKKTPGGDELIPREPLPARVPVVNLQSVPQIMLRLMSKLAQTRGYGDGLLEGIQMSRKSEHRSEEAELMLEFMENGITHLNGLIEEACSIEQELREKLRTRGEEL